MAVKKDGKKPAKMKNTGSHKTTSQNYPHNAIQYPQNSRQKAPAQTAINKKSRKKAKKGKPVGRKAIRKQRNRYIAATVLLVGILLAICVFISLKVLFIVKAVQVSGSERYSRQEIEEFCAIPQGVGIFSVDTEELERSLESEFAYIEKAVVKRRLPNKITIEITDSVPTYYTEKQEGDLTAYTVLSQNFKTLTSQASKPDGLIRLNANIENREIKELTEKIIELLNANSYDKITGIDIASTSDIRLEYDGRVQIRLGTVLDIEYKLKLSYHTLENSIDPTQKGQMDSTQAGSCIFKPDLRV